MLPYNSTINNDVISPNECIPTHLWRWNIVFRNVGVKFQTPGNYPEESIQHSEHGESLKSRTFVSSSKTAVKSSKLPGPTFIKYSYLSRQIFLSPIDAVWEQIAKLIIIQQAISTSLCQLHPSGSSVMLQHNNKTSNRYQIGIEAICAMVGWVVCYLNGLDFPSQEKTERNYFKVTFTSQHSRTNKLWKMLVLILWYQSEIQNWVSLQWQTYKPIQGSTNSGPHVSLEKKKNCAFLPNISGVFTMQSFAFYRVIHKSLRDFRTRLRNNQDRHGRK